MEASALAGLEWVVAPSIKDLVREIISYLKSDIAVDLADLETTLLPQIQLIIEAAEQMPPEALPTGWLKGLEDDYKDAKLFVNDREKKRLKHRHSSSISIYQMNKERLLQRLNEFEHLVEEAEIFLRTQKTGSKDAIIAGKSSSVTSSLVNDLLKKSISYLGTGITKDLEDLETTLLPQVRLTIQAAQRIPPDDIPPLTRWLARLTDAYDDAKAILHKVECKAKGQAPSSSTSALVKRSLFAQKKKLLQRLNNLKKVAAEAETFLDLLGIQKTISKSAIIDGKRRSVTSWLLPDKVLGRDRDRDEIIDFLCDESIDFPYWDEQGYSVVAVTGMEGVGKTTLAQYVYNDPRVESHFDVRMWICLSQNLDIIMHTREMVECASEEVCPNLRNLGNLQTNLLEALIGFHSIMIVLDDVWYDNNDGAAREKQWENFLKPFYYIDGTCKIVVTSRSTSFPFALLPKKHIELSDLAPDDLISLLRYSAIDGLQIRNSQWKYNFSDLSDVVDQIAHEMYQLPFATTIIKFLLDEQGGSSWTSYSSYPVLAVTGITGAGKTMLAKYVYNHPMVKKHFGLRMWLRISKKLDIIKFTKEMIECASHERSPNLDNLGILQEKLLETLPESDILVVLDDVWYDNNENQCEWEWERFLKPFDCIKGTCKVVVTSRSTSFPLVLKPRKLIELSDSAIDGLQIKNSRLKSDSNDLCDIVDPIDQKMSKLPLAAKIIGCQLRERPDITFWRDTLENVKLSIDGVIADISSVISSPLDKVFGRDGDRDEIINYATSPLLNDKDFATSPLFIDKDFEGDYDEIIKFLWGEQGDSSSRRSYSVVAVTGMEGAGKTTLAQYVYNDPRVKCYFDVRMWLCLPQNFDIKEATKEMIECSSGRECPNILDLDDLQDKLRETLPKYGSTLVVLDDVRYDKNDGAAREKQWENFLYPFYYIEGTCKIVVTSRSKSFPFALPPGKLIELSNLAPDAFRLRGNPYSHYFSS